VDDLQAKRLWLAAAVVVTTLFALPFVWNNTNFLRTDLKHLQSFTRGLPRHVVLYGADGSTIREWETTSVVEDEGGSCFFLDASGKAVRIAGTYVVEERE
jgi:hypothetical protein